MEGSAAPLRHFTITPSTGDQHRSLLSHHYHDKPMKVAMPHNLQSYWASVSTNIEDHLKQAVQVRPPISVYEPMCSLVFSAPRTMAPPLSIAACELVGGQPEKAIVVASVLHLMYAASTVHQHLLDRPTGPTTNSTDHRHHHAFPACVELLTADGILSFGYELLGRPSAHHNPDDKPERILKVIIEITRAMGAQGMVEGQYLQMRQSGSASGGDKLGKVRKAVEKMEGGIYACGAACGAILGGATEEETERLRSFGRYAGMIHGMMTSMGSDDGEEEEGLNETVERLRSLALKELECFDHHQPMVEKISSILHLDSLFQFTSKQNQTSLG